MPCIEVFAAGDCLTPTAEREARDRYVVGICSNLMFYLLEWVYFGINKLENELQHDYVLCELLLITLRSMTFSIPLFRY